MTILNAWISPTRALVAVDTSATSPKAEQALEVSKFLVLPHAHCVLGGAGNSILLHLLYWLLQQPGDFDFVAAAVPQLIEPARADARGQFEALCLPEAQWSPAQMIVVVGWSPRRQAMLGYYLFAEGSDAFGALEEIKPYILHPSPYAAGQNASQDPNSAGRMLQEARAQVAWGKRTHPQWAIGGRLLIAELSQAAVTITSHDLS